MSDFLDKLRTIQFGKVHHDRPISKGVYIPPEAGKLGIIIPPGLEPEEEEYIKEAELEKREKESRPLPHTKPINIERQGRNVIIED